jgi:hypothetical protein
LSTTESRYAQIEKEALAFTWACERLSDYLIGIELHIHTENKPLIPLFSTKRLEGLPPIVQRFRLRMMRYDFTISHVLGKELVVADTLSRSPVNSYDESDQELYQEIDTHVQAVVINLPVSETRMDNIRQLQQQDKV